MKKLILTCALLTSVSILSFAQSAQTAPAAAPAQPNAAVQQPPQHPAMKPEQMAERRAQVYKKQYSLTDEQYKGVYEAELDFMKEYQQMRASGKQPTPEQRQKMMDTKDAKFKKAMTPEQYTKYTAARPQPGTQPATPPATK